MLDKPTLYDRAIFGRLTTGTIAAALTIIAGCSNPPQPTAAALDFRPIGAAPNIYTVVLKADAKPAEIEAATRDHCGARDFCQVFGWIDASRVARALPMTDRELQAQAFAYSLNRSTGLDRALFDCRQFHAVAKKQCLAPPESDDGAEDAE